MQLLQVACAANSATTATKQRDRNWNILARGKQWVKYSPHQHRAIWLENALSNSWTLECLLEPACLPARNLFFLVNHPIYGHHTTPDPWHVAAPDSAASLQRIPTFHSNPNFCLRTATAPTTHRYSPDEILRATAGSLLLNDSTTGMRSSCSVLLTLAAAIAM